MCELHLIPSLCLDILRCTLARERHFCASAAHDKDRKRRDAVRHTLDGNDTARHGLAQVLRHHRFCIKCAWLHPPPSQRFPVPRLFQKGPLCVVGTPLTKANATIKLLWLQDNKIEDRGAVALADAVKVLLVTMLF